MFILINNYGEYEFRTVNAAIDAGKAINRMFMIRYDNMICCIWSAKTGIEFTESYKEWYEDQQQELARVGGWDER